MNLTCDKVQRDVLDWGWGLARRQEIAACLAHLEECPACRRAIGDYDALKVRVESQDSPEPAEPVAGWDAFEDRLIHQISTHRSARSWQLMPTAMAACLVLAALGWGMYWGGERARNSSPPGNVLKTVQPAFTQAEVSEGVRLFGQVSSVFDNRTNWVLLSNGSSDVGLGHEVAGKSGQLLYVRLVLSLSGRTVSTAELVIVPGRAADLKLPVTSGGMVQYHLRTLAGDPGRVQISAVLTSQVSDELPASMSSDLRVSPSVLTRVGEVQTPAGRLRLELAAESTRAAGHPI